MPRRLACFFPAANYAIEPYRRTAYLQRLLAYDRSLNCQSDLSRVIALVSPRPGLRVLDFGCGIGSLCGLLADQGCAIVGTDVSNEILLLAKALHPNVAFSRPEQIAGSYDVITSMHVLGHVPNPAVTLRSLWTHLAPGGRLVCVVPNPAYTIAMIPSNLLNDYLPDTTVLRLWSKRRLHSALRVAGFSGIDLCTFGEFPALFRIDALRSRLVGVAMRPQELMASA